MARRKAARKTTARKAASRTPARRKAPRKAAKKTAARRKTARKAPRKTVRAAARKAAPRRTAAKSSRKPARKAASRPVARKAASRPVARKAASRPVARKAPALNRERRIVREEEMVPSPPSSLDLDRTASSARSGRRELHERFVEHTETSPALTGGDIDADWESASTVGDEAPGGDNPTPDMDIVDDIGRAVGVEYQDNEELKGAKKVSDRDRKRWELDPASSEDYKDR